jgi:hypothetical protein
LEKIKHGFKTLAECGGIRGVDDISSTDYDTLYFTTLCDQGCDMLGILCQE